MKLALFYTRASQGKHPGIQIIISALLIRSKAQHTTHYPDPLVKRSKTPGREKTEVGDAVISTSTKIRSRTHNKQKKQNKNITNTTPRKQGTPRD
jgi:hypothetical protein